MADDFFDFDFAGFQAQVSALVSNLDRMADGVEAGAEQAAQEAAEIIAKEQRRLLSAAQSVLRKTSLDWLYRR